MFRFRFVTADGRRGLVFIHPSDESWWVRKTGGHVELDDKERPIMVKPRIGTHNKD